MNSVSLTIFCVVALVATAYAQAPDCSAHNNSGCATCAAVDGCEYVWPSKCVAAGTQDGAGRVLRPFEDKYCVFDTADSCEEECDYHFEEFSSVTGAMTSRTWAMHVGKLPGTTTAAQLNQGAEGILFNVISDFTTGGGDYVLNLSSTSSQIADGNAEIYTGERHFTIGHVITAADFPNAYDGSDAVSVLKPTNFVYSNFPTSTSDSASETTGVYSFDVAATGTPVSFKCAWTSSNTEQMLEDFGKVPPFTLTCDTIVDQDPLLATQAVALQHYTIASKTSGTVAEVGGGSATPADTTDITFNVSATATTPETTRRASVDVVASDAVSTDDTTTPSLHRMTRWFKYPAGEGEFTHRAAIDMPSYIETPQNDDGGDSPAAVVGASALVLAVFAAVLAF